MKELSWRRLSSQRLVGAPFRNPQDVVSWLGAVQAQDYAGARYGVGIRMQGATDAAIEKACDAGQLLRTHVLRPTWHFVTPADIRWLLALTGPRIQALNASYYKKVGLTPAMFRRSVTAIEKTLAGGACHTRDELRAVLLKSRAPAGFDLPMSYLMMSAELDGLICSGPRRGKQFTYALLDERAPAAGKTMSRDDALAELARRFFVSRGPATAHDFAWWSNLTLADARRGIESVAGELEAQEFEGRTFWSSPDIPRVRRKPGTAHLLSVFDEYISGYRDRPIGERHMGKLFSNGAMLLIAVVDGHIVGMWKRRFVKDAVVVKFSLFEKPAKEVAAALHRAAERYANYVEHRLELEGLPGRS